MRMFKSTKRLNGKHRGRYHLLPACRAFPDDTKEVDVATNTLLRGEVCGICVMMWRKHKHEVLKFLCLALSCLLGVPTNAQWHTFKPAGARDTQSIFDDVLSHCTPAMRKNMYHRDKLVYCHEATHGVNSDIRQCLRPGWAGMYTRNHRAFLLRNPRVRLRQVAELVDAQHRDEVYKLYLVQMRSDWDDFPLYVLDEWSAYINGAECARELRLDMRSEVMMSRKFAYFTDCLVRAIQKHDPQYAQMGLLQEFIAYQNTRLAKLQEKQ